MCCVCIRSPSNLPISSLKWNKDGTLLASSSIGDRAILIWHPDSKRVKPLKRLGPPGSLLSWSPNNEWIFAATVDRVFRVWKCHKKWTSDRWVCDGGNVQACCWSPCGRFLLFVNTADTILYRLQFVQLILMKCKSISFQMNITTQIYGCARQRACPILLASTRCEAYPRAMVKLVRLACNR